MECNKEEAIRAKGIAESKMQNKDFVVARKVAVRAQQLYPNLDNVAQMLVVCDVHCAADKKLFGNEMDWYGILQIEQVADEATVKKQYKKLALQLHPDKNKFPGAEAAFKLIGEAQSVLLDRGKRSLYDMKCKASLNKSTIPYRPPQKASYNPYGVQNNFRTNFPGLNSQHQKPQHPSQSGFSKDPPTFWTVCPFCKVRYQYYRDVVNKSLHCQNCNKPFIAYEMHGQGAPAATNLNQSLHTQQKGFQNSSGPKVELQNQGNLGSEYSKTAPSQNTDCTPEVGSEKVNGKRGRKQGEESSESCDTESSDDTEEDVVIDEAGDFRAGQSFGCYRECPRRSDRRKQNVSYKENLSDDEDFVSNPRKKAKGNGPSCATEEESGDGLKEEASNMNKQAGFPTDLKEGLKEMKQKESDCFEESLPNNIKETKNVKGKETVKEDHHKKGSESNSDSTADSNPKTTLDPENYSYPDPEFYDFDEDRKAECFSVGQIWAAYDTVDAMPRFYARIRKVSSSEFKLRITWIEPKPDDENEIKWVNADLPFSCGTFNNGRTENTEHRLMFSHLMSSEKGSGRDTYKIYPRRGETWALFKNWDIKWMSEVNGDRKYEFEFVEVLSEYTKGVGVQVAYLSKVKGYASLFCRAAKGGIDAFQILPGELLRFSHRVPSVKLTGEEREGLPRGSFELDPASLPTNLEEIAVPEELKAEVGDSNANSSSTGCSEKVKPAMGPDGASMQQAEVKQTHQNPENSSDGFVENFSSPQASASEAIEIPEPEFYNFDADKAVEKFQVGQIWSLYSDEDGLPKYYGLITKIASDDQGFELQLSWLVSFALPHGSIRWRDKKMPVCCGIFKVEMGRSQSYTFTGSFSHQLRAEPTGKKYQYDIVPRKGEVWALYRNWTAEIKYSDLENCEYDLVEVVDENDFWIKVLVLERVDGFNSVFKDQVRGKSNFTMEIKRLDLIRFSHQIPAFRLTEERGGSLRGFWELDPAALPVHYFSLN